MDVDRDTDVDALENALEGLDWRIIVGDRPNTVTSTLAGTTMRITPPSRVERIWSITGWCPGQEPRSTPCWQPLILNHRKCEDGAGSVCVGRLTPVMDVPARLERCTVSALGMFTPSGS